MPDEWPSASLRVSVHSGTSPPSPASCTTLPIRGCCSRRFRHPRRSSPTEQRHAVTHGIATLFAPAWVLSTTFSLMIDHGRDIVIAAPCLRGYWRLIGLCRCAGIYWIVVWPDIGPALRRLDGCGEKRVFIDRYGLLQAARQRVQLRPVRRAVRRSPSSSVCLSMPVNPLNIALLWKQ